MPNPYFSLALSTRYLQCQKLQLRSPSVRSDIARHAVNPSLEASRAGPTARESCNIAPNRWLAVRGILGGEEAGLTFRKLRLNLRKKISEILRERSVVTLQLPRRTA